MPNTRTGTLKLKDCECTVEVKPMSKKVNCCEKHKGNKRWMNYLLRSAHEHFNRPLRIRFPGQ